LEANKLRKEFLDLYDLLISLRPEPIIAITALSKVCLSHAGLWHRVASGTKYLEHYASTA